MEVHILPLVVNKTRPKTNNPMDVPYFQDIAAMRDYFFAMFFGHDPISNIYFSLPQYLWNRPTLYKA